MTNNFSSVILAAGKSVSALSLDYFTFLVEQSTKIYEGSLVTTLLTNQKNYLRLLPYLPKISPRTKISIIPQTKGALASALFGVEGITNDEGVLLAPLNALIPRSIVTSFIDRVTASKSSAGCLTIKSSEDEFSFVRASADGSVIEIVEKRAISNNALAGLYYYKNLSILLESSRWAFKNNLQTNGNFFISQSFNFLISKGHNIFTEEIPNSDYFRFSKPFEFEKKKKEWIDQNEKV